jgi:DNA-binding FadR family transcriptional regulator
MFSAELNTVSLTDAVEGKIYEYISANKMSPGDALPKEEELAKILRVSRIIVREALSRVRMLGLVESRRRKGMTVAEPDAFAGLERMISGGVISGGHKKDLLEVRIILEHGICDFVFQRRTEADIDELERIIKDERKKNISEAELEEIDIAFHSKLYEISGNNVVKRLQGILRPFFKNQPSGLLAAPGDAGHKHICEALRNGPAERFREAMHSHLKCHLAN